MLRRLQAQVFTSDAWLSLGDSCGGGYRASHGRKELTAPSPQLLSGKSRSRSKVRHSLIQLPSPGGKQSRQPDRCSISATLRGQACLLGEVGSHSLLLSRGSSLERVDGAAWWRQWGQGGQSQGCCGFSGCSDGSWARLWERVESCASHCAKHLWSLISSLEYSASGVSSRPAGWRTLPEPSRCMAVGV